CLTDRGVDLVGARVEEILALEEHLGPGGLGESPRVVDGRRPTHVLAQQQVELPAEVRIGAGLHPGPLELVERRDERLRYIAAAVRAEAVLDPRLSSRAHAARGASPAASAVRTAAIRASTLAGSLRPGSASVPVALSTANGWTAAIASATFTGSIPPERTIGTRERWCRASSQSQLRPVPPRSSSAWVSSMWKSASR